MATKKNSKKTKKASAPRRSPLYQTTGRNFPEMTGQAAVILAELERQQPATSAQVAEKVAGKLETKQEPNRVVSYYFQVWKSEGLVKNVKRPKEEKAAA